jgi:hypothetical protein
MRGMIHHPKLGNNFGDQLSVAEKSHDRALGNHYAYGLGHSAHVGGGNVTAAESQPDIHLCGHCIEVAARGKHNSIVTD